MKFTHQDLRLGTSHTVSVKDDVLARNAAAAAARRGAAAGNAQARHAIERTAHAVRVDVSGARAGAALLSFFHSSTRAEGKPFTPIVYGIVTCSRPEAPYAWRHIFSAYLSFVAQVQPMVTCHAPAQMPQQPPWLCTFVDQRFAKLAEQDRAETMNYVRFVAAALLVECYSACPPEQRDGPIDLEEFPELSDSQNE